MAKLTEKRIAFLAAPEGTEQIELTKPWQAVEEAGGRAELVSTGSGEIQAFNHLDKADTFTVDHVVGDVTTADYDALVLPGGVANPDFLRTDEHAVRFIEEFFTVGKTGRGDMSRALDTGRSRRRARTHHDLVSEPANRPAKRRCQLGRRGSRGGCGPDHQPRSRRPSRVLRHHGRRVRRGATHGRRLTSAPEQRSASSGLTRTSRGPTSVGPREVRHRA